MKYKLISIVLLFALCISTGVVLAEDTTEYDKTTIDDNSPLNSGENINEYDDVEVTTAHGTAPDIQYTIAKDAGDIDSYNAGFFENMGNYWLVLDYNEDRPIDLRLHLDESYITPYTVSDTETKAGNSTFNTNIVNKGESMSISVKMDSSDTYVVPLDTSQAQRSKATDILSTRIPFIDDTDVFSSEEWQYVSDDAFAMDTDATYAIQAANPDDIVVQYEDGEDWEIIPESSTTSKPYYQMERSGDNNVYVVNTDVDKQTDIRYKSERTTTDNISEIQNGFDDIISNMREDLSSLF